MKNLNFVLLLGVGIFFKIISAIALLLMHIPTMMKLGFITALMEQVSKLFSALKSNFIKLCKKKKYKLVI